jgi:hypothetical protein
MVSGFLTLLVTQYGAPSWVASAEVLEGVLSIGTILFGAGAVYFRKKATTLLE